MGVPVTVGLTVFFGAAADAAAATTRPTAASASKDKRSRHRLQRLSVSLIMVCSFRFRYRRDLPRHEHNTPDRASLPSFYGLYALLISSAARSAQPGHVTAGELWSRGAWRGMHRSRRSRV